MPVGVYERKKRSDKEILASMRSRLFNMSIPEPTSGCWLFTGHLDHLGYGRMAKTKFERIFAHRASYEVFKGTIPLGMNIMHSCDLRCCVNPDHLRLGTHSENMADMVRKGRTNSSGYRNPKERNCAICGMKFMGGDRKLYCSKDCINRRYREARAAMKIRVSPQRG